MLRFKLFTSLFAVFASSLNFTDICPTFRKIRHFCHATVSTADSTRKSYRLDGISLNVKSVPETSSFIIVEMEEIRRVGVLSSCRNENDTAEFAASKPHASKLQH